ncbi:hypothetical protein BCR34DRAFT_571623 [Clohesyomyces aquaticus]|uniref:FAD-binding domain-containing protein n=1 Tax=Clohesyomyces aquaticus TaxID=1231657 RepID=A0A1Y1Z6Y8_9PLEO|nr:hypothetical protein BCR34DRAFT_571623 [Clohesyomyces aquaticus]
MPLNILITGAGVSGPVLAHLLRVSNPSHNITIIERSPSLRLAGQQIDIKSHGVPIIAKLGLRDAIVSKRVNETGAEMVDAKGRSLGRFGIDEAEGGEKMGVVGKRGLGFTSEIEIMRGDLVRVVVEGSLGVQRRVEEDAERGKKDYETQRAKKREGNGKGRETSVGTLTYEFNKTLTSLSQHSDSVTGKPAGVTVTFSTNEQKTYDLVIGADGQSSQTRRLAFSSQISNSCFHSLGIHTAYYSIPSLPSDLSTLARIHISTSQRAVMTRNGDRDSTQIYLFTMASGDALRVSYKQDIVAQKAVWREIFTGVGWQAERFLDGMDKCADFYACELGQVKLPSLYNGRVVLLGDAGYCPSPFTGLGTTVSLAGAWVLAGELARHGDDVDGALEKYDGVMKPAIREWQELQFGDLGTFFPKGRWGVWVLENGVWVMDRLMVRQIVGWVWGSGVWVVEKLGVGKLVRFMVPKKEKDGGWKLPEYPELGLGALA